MGTYRIIIPDSKSLKVGRGFRGAREEVLTESAGREVLDDLLRELDDMVSWFNPPPSSRADRAPAYLYIQVGDLDGPKAIRHILNPACNRDEGIRLIWPDTGEEGDVEMADWPRRDTLIKMGKTVRAADDLIETTHRAPLGQLVSVPMPIPIAWHSYRAPCDKIYGGGDGMWASFTNDMVME